MPKISLKIAPRLLGGLKLARLLVMGESEFAASLAKLEADPRFKQLLASGAVRHTPFPQAAFAARRFAGMQLASGLEGIAEALDGRSELSRLIKKIGRERFEACFLGTEKMTDKNRAQRCGISAREARSVRSFLDRMYIREEFEPAPASAAAKVYSTVAGVGVKGGRPFLRFFHRDVWRGRYALDEDRLGLLLGGLPEDQRERTRRFISRLRFLDRRKTTLYAVLQALLSAQEGYFTSGDPDRLVPLTQRAVAAAVDAEPSVINRLILNKAVELPWGTEVPMKELFASAKSLAKQRVARIAEEEPGLSDEGIRVRLADEHEIRLSRRSIAQYRHDLGLGGRGRR